MTNTVKLVQTNASGDYDAARISLSLVAQSPIQPELPILPEAATALEVRQRMIEEAAYYLAEKRGFTPGHELDDWLAAEIAVDRGPLQGARPVLIDRRRR